MPNRIIKDTICTSEKLATLSDFEFRLWIGLITQADDMGRGDARPAVLKGRVFPLRERVTNKDIQNALCALAAASCVSLYEVDGKPYYEFPNWSEHQRIRNVKPKYPGPVSAAMQTQLVFADCGNSPQTAADCGNSPQTAADCGNSPQTAADCGLNTIQSESNTIQSEQESNARVCAYGAMLASWDDDKIRRMIKNYRERGWALMSGMERWLEDHPEEKL